jgi:tRNA A-37 threonylcarbamoyl transferase component Bud32
MPRPSDRRAADAAEDTKASSADLASTGEWRPDTTTAKSADAATGDFLNPAQQPGEIGRLGDYVILQVLGRGGMGIVFQAREQKLNRVVALKMILTGEHAGDHEVARFRTEAEAIARLQHPNIVQVFEVGEHRGKSFLSLEYCAGGSLEKKLRGQPLPPGQAAQLVETLARAMQAAHEHQIIHRDLKPANILLSAEGTPKITDFGLAKKLDQESGQTQSGAVMGTPSYMAPEQARGDAGRAGPPADIYALGAILYDCLTGRPPFKGDSTWDTINQVIHNDPVPPRRLQPRVPRDVETICLKCLQKEPARRYGSALALAEDLRRFQFGEPVHARRVGRAARLWRWCRRNPVVAALSAAVLLSLLVGAGVAAYFALERNRSAADLSTTLQVQGLWDGLENDLRLPAEQWAPEHIALVKSRLQELDALDAARGNAGRRRVYKETAPALARQLIDQRQVRAEQEEQIRRLIDLVAEHEPAEAAELRKELQLRLTRLESVFLIEAPFDKVPAAFATATDHIKVRQDALTSAIAAEEKLPAPLMLTNVSSQGGVGLKATFNALATAATAAGLLVEAQDTKRWTGYAFVLRARPIAGSGTNQRTVSLAEAQAQGLPIYQQIVRDGIVLRERPLAPFALPVGRPVLLFAQRDGERLSFQVNDYPPLEFVEVFPTRQGGVFGILWPDGIPLSKLQGLRRPLPAQPTVVETGDKFFAAGEYEKAVQEYQRVRPAANEQGRQEAQVKEALAWMALEQHREATLLLEKVASQSGPRWPYVAACQLWLLHLREKDFARAEMMQSQLLTRQQLDRIDQVAAWIPLQDRQRIVSMFYHQSFRYLSMSRAELGQHIERLKVELALMRAFEFEAAHRAVKLQELVRTYRYNGQEREATEALRQWFSQERIDPLRLTHEWIWLMIEQGQAAAALPELEKIIAAGGFQPYWPKESLVVEHARLLAAVGRTADAEAALHAYLQPRLSRPLACTAAAALACAAPSMAPLATPALAMPGAVSSPPDYRGYSDACLLLGFLLADRGDVASARRLWTLAVFPGDLLDEHADLSGVGVFTAFVAGFLSDQVTDTQLDRTLDWGLRKANFPRFLVPAIKRSLPPLQTLRTAASGPRAQDYARQFAYRKLPFRQMVLSPADLIGTELICEQAFGGKFPSAGEETLVRAFLRDAVAGYQEKQLTTGTTVTLALTWLRPLDFKAADSLRSLRSALPAPLVGPAAYIMGRRYLQMGRHDDAAVLLRESVKVAAPDSDLARFATEALRQAKAKS